MAQISTPAEQSNRSDDDLAQPLFTPEADDEWVLKFRLFQQPFV